MSEVCKDAEKVSAENAGIGKGTPGPGRKKGVPNKLTSSVKAALQKAFEDRGGVDALVTWAKDNETEFYKLWGRLAPTEVSASVDGSLVIRVVRE